jgi:ABC-type sugar transport system substrate-binding protein
MQLGAIQAMKEAGLKPGEDVLMVSVDYVPAIKDALDAGEANASVELALRRGRVHLSGGPRLPR